MNIIKIKWSGPFSLNEIENSKESIPSKGIYQYIGIHPITGPETLLYIGISSVNLGKRIFDHANKAWFWDFPDYKVYLGEVKNSTEENINNAETLLVYRLSPPYNSQKINKNYDTKETIVLNYGTKHRLPFEVTNLPEMVNINGRDKKFEIA